MNNLQWELYFVRQEKEAIKRRKQNSRKRLAGLVMAAVVLVLAAAAGGVSFFRSYYTEYGKLERAVKQDDYRLAAVKMAQYVNEKYGEGVCRSEQLTCKVWDPSDTREYLGIQAVSEEDPGKQIYMIYLSEEQVLYLDTYQWEEISSALEAEAAKRVGLQNVSCDRYRYTDLEMRKRFYFCPWAASAAYITKYEDDLDTFFAQEAEMRKKLPYADDLEELQINGAVALYFGDPEIPDMKKRLENPELSYAERFEQGLKGMGEKYQINIEAAVLYQDAYEAMEEVLEKKEDRRVNPGCYLDYGEKGMFFSPSYTVLSLSRGEVFRAEAEEAETGIYFCLTNGEKLLENYTYTTGEPEKELQEFAETAFADWQMAKTFSCKKTKGSPGKQGFYYTMVLDLEQLYPDQEVRILGWYLNEWREYTQKEWETYPQEKAADSYVRDGSYRIIGTDFGYGENKDGFGEHREDIMFSILTK